MNVFIFTFRNQVMCTQSNGHKKKTLETAFGTTSWTTFGNAMTAAGGQPSRINVELPKIN